MDPTEETPMTSASEAPQSPNLSASKVKRLSIEKRIGLVIGIAAIIISLSEAYWDGRSTIAITVAAGLVAAIFGFEPWLKQNLKGAIPAIAIVVLGLTFFLASPKCW